MGNIEKRNPVNIVYGVLTIIVTIIVIVWIQTDKSDTVSEPSIETEDVEEVSQVNYDYLLRSEWDGLERAEKNIQTLGEGQVISQGIVQDPTDENIVYFASITYSDSDIEDAIPELRSVYKYDTDNYNFERLFRETPQLSRESLGSYSIFHVIGYDHGLILRVAPQQWFEQEECQNLHYDLISATGLSLMNPEDPYGKLENYTLPGNIKRTGQEEFEKCLSENQ